MALWTGLLVCRPERLWQPVGHLASYLGTRMLWFFPGFPVTDQAVYKRLHSAGTKPLERLFEQISGVLAQRLQGVVTEKLAPFAEGVVCIDESTLDAMSRRLPPLREIPQGDSRLLPGKLAGVFDVRGQQWRTVMFQPGDPHQNEKVLARKLVEDLPVGNTGGRTHFRYFGFAWFDWLTDRGYHWLSRLTEQRPAIRLIHTFYQRGDVFDGIVWLGAHRTFRPGQTRRSAGDFQTRHIRCAATSPTFGSLTHSRLHPWPRSTLAGRTSRWRSHWSSSISSCVSCGLRSGW